MKKVGKHWRRMCLFLCVLGWWCIFFACVILWV